jgi:hypothetical protein
MGAHPPQNGIASVNDRVADLFHSKVGVCPHFSRKPAHCDVGIHPTFGTASPYIKFSALPIFANARLAEHLRCIRDIKGDENAQSRYA